MLIQRLNMDSSWHLSWDDTTLVVDPWLMGSEIDGGPWLNEQWHVVDPIAPQAVPAYQGLLITQSYNDHCHMPTLEAMDDKAPILATGKAMSRLRKKFPARKLLELTEQGPALQFGNLWIEAFRPAKWLDPIYYSVLIRDQFNNALYYAPHGFELTATQLQRFNGLKVHLLITTFTDFQLPALLGGHVNPGLDAMRKLVDALQPRHVLNTHDEPKRMQGLVARFAKVEYAPYARLLEEPDLPFVHLDGYQPLSLPIQN